MISLEPLPGGKDMMGIGVPKSSGDRFENATNSEGVGFRLNSKNKSWNSLQSLISFFINFCLHYFLQVPSFLFIFTISKEHNGSWGVTHQCSLWSTPSGGWRPRTKIVNKNKFFSALLKILLKVLMFDVWCDGRHCKAKSHDMIAYKEEFQWSWLLNSLVGVGARGALKEDFCCRVCEILQGTVHLILWHVWRGDEGERGRVKFYAKKFLHCASRGSKLKFF